MQRRETEHYGPGVGGDGGGSGDSGGGGDGDGGGGDGGDTGPWPALRMMRAWSQAWPKILKAAQRKIYFGSASEFAGLFQMKRHRPRQHKGRVFQRRCRHILTGLRPGRRRTGLRRQRRSVRLPSFQRVHPLHAEFFGGDTSLDYFWTSEQNGPRHRGLRPLDPQEAKLLTALARGEHLISGFRNRDLRRALFGETDDATRRRQAGQITRRLALLRVHGLIKKIPHTLRYQLTVAGTQALPALIALPNTPLARLSAA